MARTHYKVFRKTPANERFTLEIAISRPNNHSNRSDEKSRGNDLKRDGLLNWHGIFTVPQDENEYN